MLKQHFQCGNKYWQNKRLNFKVRWLSIITYCSDPVDPVVAIRLLSLLKTTESEHTRHTTTQITKATIVLNTLYDNWALIRSFLTYSQQGTTLRHFPTNLLLWIELRQLFHAKWSVRTEREFCFYKKCQCTPIWWACAAPLPPRHVGRPVNDCDKEQQQSR